MMINPFVYNDFDGYFIIIGGQSNFTPRFTSSGNISAAYQSVLPFAQNFYKPVDNYTNNGSWVDFQAGVNDTQGTPLTGQFGVSTIIANRMWNTYGKPCYFVPLAIGGSYIADDVNPSWNASHISQYAKRSAEYAWQAYIAIRGTKKLKVVYLDGHGESDADTVAHGNAYKANKIAYYNYIRTFLGFENMPIVATKLRYDYDNVDIGGTGANLGRPGVRQAEVDLQTEYSNYFLVDIDASQYALCPDGQHWSPTSASWQGVMSAVNVGNTLTDYIHSYVRPINQSQYWKQGIVTATSDAEATTLINAMVPAPDATRQQVIKDFFITYKAQADTTLLTSQFGFLSVLAAHGAQPASLWWNDPTKIMTLGGVVPTFTVDRGYKNSGNGWIDSLFNPSMGANFSQNNGGIFVYVRDNVAEDKTDIGVINASTVLHTASKNVAGNTSSSVNQGGSLTGLATLDSRGLWHTRRINANYVELYRNGCFVSGGTNISLAACNGNVYILCFNDLTAVPFQFSTKQIGAAGICDNSVNPLIFYNTLQNKYMIPIGANV